MHWWNLMEKWRSIATSTYNHHHGPKTYPMPIQGAMHPNLCGNFKWSPKTYRSRERVKFQKNQLVLNTYVHACKPPERADGDGYTKKKKLMGKMPKKLGIFWTLGSQKKNKIQHKMSENALNYLKNSIRKEQQERKNKPKTLWNSATMGSE